MRSHFNKIGIKVALVVTLLIVVLLTSLFFVVVNRGQKSFRDVYQAVGVQNEFPPIDKPFFYPDEERILLFPYPREMTPQEHFTTRFESSLVMIGILAFLGAIGVGVLTSHIITKPLSKISQGMKKLRQNHYNQRLEEDSSDEINAVIKEFNSLAEELKRVEELRKNLISDTSHELKTPLASLTAQLEGIDDGVLSLDAQRVQLLRKQVSRLTELVEGLQDFARLRSESVVPQKEHIRIRDIFQAAQERFAPRLRAAGMQVLIPADEALIIEADPKIMDRVCDNLFENALRYSRAQHITVTADEKRIVFSDDGIGIPAEHLQDIFERFYRVEKSRNRETGGLGLGLAIVKEIVEAHGWKIHAEIPENNKGVAFVITLQ